MTLRRHHSVGRPWVVLLLLLLGRQCRPSRGSIVRGGETPWLVCSTTTNSTLPCVVAHVNPQEESNSTSHIVTLVQVTPWHCRNHRDGALAAVELQNGDNGGQVLGKSDNLQFQYISVIAGKVTGQDYSQRHAEVLQELVDRYKPQYIVGTCSEVAAVETPIANQAETILLAQVGPSSYYANSNPFLFGIHLNSDDYVLANLKALAFHAPPSLPSRIIYRTDDFYASTCETAAEWLQDNGMLDVQLFPFDPMADDDGNNVANQDDDSFLRQLADQACNASHPALILCTAHEQNFLLQQWLANACRPTSLWMMAATSTWGNANSGHLPYVQSSAQWHADMGYADRYWDSGQAFLQYMRERFQYEGTYDQVASYTIPYLIGQHLETHYHEEDTPNPLLDFSTSLGREQLRATLRSLRTETLFGPIAFDTNQRNIARAPASVQWLPSIGINQTIAYTSTLVAPLQQAQAATHLPAWSSLPCPAGQYVNLADWSNRGALLLSGCTDCAVDSFLAEDSLSSQCQSCPSGSSTQGLEGQSMCIEREQNLVSQAVLVFGYFVTSLSWCCSLACLGWVIWFRKDDIVRVSQKEFLGMICAGTFVSSSTVIALSFEAEEDESTDAASAACKAAPFLYTIGWILQYTSLAAKTYRLHVIKRNRKRERIVNIPFEKVFKLVVLALLIDLALVISMIVVNPLVYERERIGQHFDPDTGVLTLESVGRCRAEDPDGVSLWAFLGPIVAFHFSLIVVANIQFFKVRHERSTYQESKFISVACLLMFEIVLVGIPLVISVIDLPTATHLVFIALVSMNDLAMLGVIFLPKIYFQMRAKEKSEDHAEILEPMRPRSRSRRASVSHWDQAVATINELLDEESETHQAMTDEQVKQLEMIKKLLMQQGDDRADKLLHLPLQLIKKGVKVSAGAVQTGVKSGVGVVKKLNPVNHMASTAFNTGMKPVYQVTDSVLYILKEFGGIVVNTGQDNGAPSRLCGSEDGSCDEDHDALDFVLPEFQLLTKEEQVRVFKLLSWSSLKRWEFNVFDLIQITKGNPLLFVGWAILGSPHAQYGMAHVCGYNVQLEELKGYHFSDSELRIPHEILCDYLRVMEMSYKEENPYHNQIHAADVVQTVHTLIQMIGYEFETTKLDLFSVLLAAVVHDVNHPGQNNAYQANAWTDLALLYNDQSILENRHASHAFRIMLGDEHPKGWALPSRRLSHINHGRSAELNLLCNVTPTQLKSIRTKVIDAVLHTDMSKHFASVNAMKALLMSREEGDAESRFAFDDDEDTTWKMLCYLLHVADISNPAKPDPLFKIWTDRCLEEFFAQGDKEEELGLPISPNCCRRTTKKADSQIGFIQFVILPAYEVLGKILPLADEWILPIIHNNADFWQGMKEVEDQSAEAGDNTSER